MTQNGLSFMTSKEAVHIDRNYRRIAVILPNCHSTGSFLNLSGNCLAIPSVSMSANFSMWT